MKTAYFLAAVSVFYVNTVFSYMKATYLLAAESTLCVNTQFVCTKRDIRVCGCSICALNDQTIRLHKRFVLLLTAASVFLFETTEEEFRFKPFNVGWGGGGCTH